MGIIQPSILPYLTPAFLNMKENVESRSLMNSKELNEKIVMNNNGPPKNTNIDKCITEEAIFFCQMDLLLSYIRAPAM